MDLPTILLILSALSIGATVIAMVVALRSAREARTAIFPIVKEEESTRARRARVSIVVWLVVTAVLLGGWLASIQLTDSAGDADATVSAEAGVVEFATEPAAETSVPAEAAATATLETPASGVEQPSNPTNTPVVATPTPIPVEPTATPVPLTPTPTQTRVPLGPAPAEAALGPIEFATEINSSPITAINPGSTFAAGARVYAVYGYQGMERGNNFSIVWYQNNIELAREQSPWPWGSQGNSYSFFLPPGEGTYKLELYVNDTLLASNSFTVR